MAYERVNWQSGTKVSDGYVEIDGTQHTVNPPVYSGSTPVNPATLNIMDEGIDENSKMLNGKLTVENITLDKIEFKNKFDKNTITENSIIDLDGSEVSGKSGWCATDFIPIKANTKYVYQGITNQGSEKYSAYYDSNKQFISYFRQETGINKRITTPNGAQYIRFSMLISDIDAFQLELGEWSTEYSSYKELTFGGNLGINGSDKVGMVKWYAGPTAPEGYLICDGSAISRTEYSDLFATIGTFYGSGDGSTTFNIPNVEGRVIAGLDHNDTDFDTLGETLGEKTHTLTIEELPGMVTVRKNKDNGSGNNNWSQISGWGNYQNSSTGDLVNQPYSIIQPTIVLNAVIKAYEETPTLANVVDNLNGNSTTDAPSVHAVNEIINNLNNYSNEEIIVGTFFDKPKYRKCFKINGSLSTISTGISDMEDLVDLRILVKDTSNGYWRPIPWTFNDSSYNSSFTGGVIISSTGNSIIFQAGNGLTNTSKYIAILEYTKTTD